MSLPSTPWPREASSPVSASSGSPFSMSQELTPRSKVKALIAAVDDDSNTENDTQSHRSPLSRLATNKTSTSTGSHEKRDQVFRDYSGTDGEESDEAPIIPRGRLATRLRARNVYNSGPTIVKSHEPNESLHQAIKGKVSIDHDSDHNCSPNQQWVNSAEDLDELKRPVSAPIKSRVTSPGLSWTSRRTRTLQSTASPVTSNKAGSGSDSGSEPDLPDKEHISRRLQMLVAQKKEQHRREAAKAQRNAEVQAQCKSQTQFSTTAAARRGSMSSSSSIYNSEDQARERKLTQQSRPTRKASKKALEEMNRETQRMNRNMQLAHQAKTKKRISKESFFSRFSFGKTNLEKVNIPQVSSSSTVITSTSASDEDVQTKDSPPSSPQEPEEVVHTPKELSEAQITAEDVTDVLPNNLSVLPRLSQTSSVGSNRAAQSGAMTSPQNAKQISSLKSTKRPIRVRLSKQPLHLDSLEPGSESDLEIVPSRKLKISRLAAFDRLPPAGGVKEERSLQNLRALAFMNSPEYKSSFSKQAVNMSSMQTALQQRARAQAAAERAERIQTLKDRGVIIQSAEEREKDQAEVEDLVEKARREAKAVMEREKRTAQKQRVLNGNDSVTQLTSDEDEDYQSNDADHSDIDFSGSDEDDAWEEEQHDYEGEFESGLEDDDTRELEGKIRLGQEPFIDVEASENSEKDLEGERNGNSSHDESVVTISRRKPRVHRQVVNEDSSEGEDTLGGHPPAAICPTVQMPLIPEIPFANGVPMGITQAFEATMAETQTQAVVDPDQGQDSIFSTKPIPKFDLTVCNSDTFHQMIPDSQDCVEAHNIDSNENKLSTDETPCFLQSQSQDCISGGDQVMETGTQCSEIPDPTQDVGFIISPIQNRFVSAPPSTVDTVMLSVDRDPPVMSKRGRLRRRMHDAVKGIKSFHETASDEGADVPQVAIDAFDVLKKAGNESVSKKDAFDKTKSEAKDLVEDQAQESEDEYAGLGGVSEEENAGEDEEEFQNMIDEDDVDVDERELAAFYANKERATDQKAVEKLFKDLHNGGLRRKRGAGLDLSDSDDDLEARRRAKRREFAKMRKALLENEKLGKIAEDPKKLPFLRAIEDRSDDENLEFLDATNNSQENLVQEIPNSQPNNQPVGPLTTRKRPLEDSAPDAGNRLPPPLRHTRVMKKPSTLAEIRASVSFLIEDPQDPLPLPQPLSSSPPGDPESHPKQPPSTTTTTSPFAARRNPNPVIDRLSLKRAESASAAITSRLAFHDSSSIAPVAGGFQVPSLLRRATTTQLLKQGAPDKHGISTLATTERTAGGEKDVVKKGGTRKSSIGYFARGREGGKERMEERERRRVTDLKRVGRMRSGLGGLAMGSFE